MNSIENFKLVTPILFHTALFIGITQTGVAQFKQGGFGNFFIGPQYNLSSSLQRELNATNLIGGGLKLNAVTLTYGGAGYSVRPKNIVLGGSGYAYKVSSEGVNGKVDLDNGCGFFNLGYRVINNKRWIGFPYMGMGGYGANLKITNSSSNKTFPIGNDTISPQQVAKYSTGGIAFDVGFPL